jgi:hypothetical protein
MNQFSFDVIGDKRENPEDPHAERKEDGFPVRNVELLIGYWTCRGPLTGGNLGEYLGKEKFKDQPVKWSQDEYDIGQYTVHRIQFFLECEDIWDVIKFLNTQRKVASQSDKQTLEEFTSEVIPIFRSALSWLQTSKDSSAISWSQTSEYPRKGVRLVTRYYA